MPPDTTAPTNVDEYIAGFAPDVRERLVQIRTVIRQQAPDAREKISYGIAGYMLHGHLVFFAAYKKHIGIYPVPAGDDAFQERSAPYRAAKSSLHLPYTESVPLDLVAQLVDFRLQENLASAAAKATT